MVKIDKLKMIEAVPTGDILWSTMYHTIQDTFTLHEFNDEADVIEYLDKVLPCAKRIPYCVEAIELAVYTARGNDLTREKLTEIFSAKKTEYSC